MAMPQIGAREDRYSQKFRMQFSKTRMCSFYKEGRCNRGTLCVFAHQEEELRQRPDLNKTALCPLKETCTDPECKYAHCLSELRCTDEFVKTNLCRYHLAGKCKLGDNCLHSHSGDLQKRTSIGSNSSCSYDTVTTAGTVAIALEDAPPVSRTSTTSTLGGIASSCPDWSEGQTAQACWTGTAIEGINTWTSASFGLWQVMHGAGYSSAQETTCLETSSNKGIKVPTAWLQNGGISSSKDMIAIGNVLVAVGENLTGNAT